MNPTERQGASAAPRLILDFVYEHEAQTPDRLYLTQPIGGREVVDYTWGQVVDQARRMAAHLKTLGLEPGARIAMLSANCAHFIMAELAIWMAGGTTVAIFPNEAPATVRHVLEHSGPSLLFVGKLDQWAQQRSAVPDDLPCIALPLAPPTPFEPWDDITRHTAPQVGNVVRAPGDLAMICYTSGSTGEPTGVMHSFERVSDTSIRIVDYLGGIYGAGVTGRSLSYLPLAHIFERAWVECASLVDGRGHIYFTESLETFAQDLIRARPNGFISVPRLWLKFQQAVHARMSPDVLDGLLDDPVSGPVVAREVLKGMGLDQVITASSGSAPIPPELIDWYRRLGLNLMEGYGMTEDFAYSHGSSDEFHAPGYVGVPLPGVEVRISDEGEVLIKSPGQTVGYYRRPDLDAESFTADDYFRSGDQGDRLPNGLLKITGRLKEIFKTSKGKYVAPAPIENRLLAHPMVESAIVSGSGQAAPYAVVVLTEDWRAKVDKTISRVQVEMALSSLLADVNGALAHHEKLAMVVVAPQPWSVENGCLTPTLKIKRARIEAMLGLQAARWTAQRSPVVWATS